MFSAFLHDLSQMETSIDLQAKVTYIYIYIYIYVDKYIYRKCVRFGEVSAQLIHPAFSDSLVKIQQFI